MKQSKKRSFKTTKAFYGLALPVLALMFSFIVLPASNSYAQAPDIADTPCDPEYYDSLEARAWLEAQREITQNQNLIYKPDSVLEYTCFDQFMTLLKAGSSSMFSDNNARWGVADGDLPDAIEDLVEEAVENYLKANFDYKDSGDDYYDDFLNGRETGVSASGGAYTCKIMHDVWMKAKCYDFIHTEETDGFFTFEEYAASNKDKRQFPDACPWTDDPSLKERWQDEIKNSFDHETHAWVVDDIVTFFENMDAAECDSETATIPTGVKVRRTQAPQLFNEKVCLAPGCYYVPTGEDTGSCQSNL